MDSRENTSRYSPSFKAKVVLKAIMASDTDTEIASAFGIHPVTLSRWKNEFLRSASSVFSSNSEGDRIREEMQILQKALQQREKELEFLQSVIEEAVPTDDKVELVARHKQRFGLNRACELLALPKSTYYYRINQDEEE